MGDVVRKDCTILVVEDDADIRASIADVLEHQGYRVLGAANGLEALDALRRADPLPCLILLDLMMPIMDGSVFRAKQLENPTWSPIPVLLMSAYRDIDEQAKALGVEYMAKPLGVRRLMEGIRRYCPCNGAAPGPGPADSGTGDRESSGGSSGSATRSSAK